MSLELDGSRPPEEESTGREVVSGAPPLDEVLRGFPGTLADTLNDTEVVESITAELGPCSLVESESNVANDAVGRCSTNGVDVGSDFDVDTTSMLGTVLLVSDTRICEVDTSTTEDSTSTRELVGTLPLTVLEMLSDKVCETGLEEVDKVFVVRGEEDGSPNDVVGVRSGMDVGAFEEVDKASVVRGVEDKSPTLLSDKVCKTGLEEVDKSSVVCGEKDESPDDVVSA